MIHEDACITSEALDKYAVVFHNPLSVVQIKASAALFGWSPPEEKIKVGSDLASQGS
jgi:hypothetical protein